MRRSARRQISEEQGIGLEWPSDLNFMRILQFQAQKFQERYEKQTTRSLSGSVTIAISSTPIPPCPTALHKEPDELTERASWTELSRVR